MNDWSDDEDNNIEEEDELIQPSRDFPPSDEENEENDNQDYEYDMFELTKLTMNKTSDDLFIKSSVEKDNKKEVKEVKKEKTVNSIWNNEYKEVKKSTVRKFNPRLPPPNKYNRNNKSNFNLDVKDFPTL